MGRLHIYSATIAVLGAVTLFSLLIGLVRSESGSGFWPGALALLALYLLSASWIIPGPEGGAVFTATPVLCLTLLFVSGAPLAALAAGTHVAYIDLRVRRIRDHRVFFNAGQRVLSIAAAGWVYSRLGGLAGPPELNSLATLTWHLPLQLAGAHLTYLLLNTSFSSCYIALRDSRSPWFLWRVNYLPLLGKSFATPLSAYVLARLFLASEYLGIVLLFSLMLVERVNAAAKVSIIRSRNRAVDTLLSISGATRPYSPEEAAERSALAQEMGRRLGLSHSRLEVLHDAILLHNIGYVGVDPCTLQRKGPLSDEELETVQKHPLIGAHILLRVPRLREVAWVVLTHHERPDGQGYPLSLNAGEAPLEAYIVAVAEGYCSLKYGRDHQEALGSQRAYDKMVSLAGSRYDRAAVAALGRALGVPVPPMLLPYLQRRPGRGDPHLKKHHLARATPKEGIHSPESLRLFASFDKSRPGGSLLAMLRGFEHEVVGWREVFRGRLFAVALAAFTLALLLYAQDFGPLGKVSGVATPLFWLSLTAFASLLMIRLPAGASVTAASSVVLAGSFVEGPLLGATLGALAGAISHAMWKEDTGRPPGRGMDRLRGPAGRAHRPISAARAARHRARDGRRASGRHDHPLSRSLSRSRARSLSRPLSRSRTSALPDAFILPAAYAAAAGLAGLVFQLAGGHPAAHPILRPSWILATVGALAGVLLYSAIEMATMSGRRTRDRHAPRRAFIPPSPLSPPLPSPLSPWERWRANYRDLFPEPLAYPAAGLLMALTYRAIGPWSLGVILIYPVLWSHFRLEERLRLTDCRLRLLLSISQAIDERHHYTQGHSLRVGLWAGAIAREMGYPEEFARDLRLAGVLHDLGKASWTDAMLEKPRKLTPHENRLKEDHPVLGARVARASFPQVETAILQHHEDWDGAGYPHGIDGWRATAGARILRVADTLDAIGSGRPYKLKEGRKDPVDEILRCAHTDFDPAVVASLASLLGRVPRPGSDGASPRSRSSLGLAAGEAELEPRRPERWWRHLIKTNGRFPLGAGGAASAAGAEIRQHAKRVAALADLLADLAGLEAPEREALRLAARKHDCECGLFFTAIARPPTRLDFHDLACLGHHPERSAGRLRRWGRERRARVLARHLRERWDGGGIPGRLREDAIPLGSRVLALACCLDRLLMPQPFRRPLAPAAAARAIAARSGTVFDPRLAELVVALLGESSTCESLIDPRASIGPDRASPAGASTGLAPAPCPEVRSPRERLHSQCRRISAWAEDLGLPIESARLLLFRHELPGGKGPQGIEWGELTPHLARFKLETLLLDILRHQPRPLTGAILRRALERLDSFADWAIPAEVIRAFRAEVQTQGLPPLVGFAEWDHLTGSVELGDERARDEAILFAYALWAEGAFATTPDAELSRLLAPLYSGQGTAGLRGEGRSGETAE